MSLHCLEEHKQGLELGTWRNPGSTLHQEDQVIQATLHLLHLQQHLQQVEQFTRGRH